MRRDVGIAKEMSLREAGISREFESVEASPVTVCSVLADFISD